MKTAIIYVSRHHGNTKKLIEAIAERYDVTVIDAAETKKYPLSGFQLIGFASGVYYGDMDKDLTEFAKNCLPKHKKVFLMETFGARPAAKKIVKAIEEKECEIIGRYGCRGFDTFGPFQMIGGISKGHPTPGEIGGAIAFFEGLIENGR